MTKQQLVNYLNNGVPNYEIPQVITDYCREKGKDDDKIEKLVDFLSLNPLIVGGIIQQILSEASVEHSIIKVFDKDGRFLKAI